VERELLGAEDADYGLVARHTSAITAATTDADADAVSDAGSDGSSSDDEGEYSTEEDSSAEHPADRTVRHCAYTHFLTWLLLLKHIHRYASMLLTIT
jgi:hypothetical protein